MCFPSRFVALLLAVLVAAGGSLAASPACSWVSADYADVALACYGPRVTAIPRLLPATLQTLQLSGTGLRVLRGDTFSGRHLPRLRLLSVTDGALTSVAAGALCSFTALTVLDLSNNRLHQVDASSFECNRHLRRVDLSGNTGLGRLPALVSDFIETVDADGCSIADVDVDDLRGLPALKVLHLRDNPGLDCRGVKQRLARSYPSLVVVCDESQAFSGRAKLPSAQLPSDTWNNSPQHVTSTETDTGREIDLQNSVTQLHIEDQKVSTAVTPSETVAGPQIDSKNSLTQLHIEDQTVSTVVTYLGTVTGNHIDSKNSVTELLVEQKIDTATKSLLDLTTEVPIKHRAETSTQSTHAFTKIKSENIFVVTNPKEFYELDSIFLISMGVLLPSILLLTLLVYYLKTKAND
ncbi:uncharacterized protein LOC126281482 [Schistocerca gregaria]|uniref:uncharacterized protein LOC126281482 n=1 Tax=Schistocerca gregaria TaxID=7010 RepID=UPI00211EBCF9|nr:uncharacterized protein LOC126281482 [Schistocerca gregaria]